MGNNIKMFSTCQVLRLTSGESALLGKDLALQTPIKGVREEGGNGQCHKVF